MHNRPIIAVLALCLGGCTTAPVSTGANIADKDTRSLCRIVATDLNQTTRSKAADLLVRRGATVEKCKKLIQADNAIMTGIAVAGAAAAVGAAAHNGYGGGGYYRPYGAAWDQFYNQYGQVTWRCRDRSSGQFVYDHHCAGMPMIDSAWPGPYI